MTGIKSQSGQALVLIALAAVILFGFAALAIDSSRVYADKRHAQNAADTSAIAAALAKIRQQDYKAIAIARAAENGYTNDTDSTVTVNLCNEVGVSCLALPAGAKPEQYIRVRITSVVPMTLGRIVGWQTMTNDVEAIARVKGTEPDPGTPTGAGLVAIRNDNSDKCFLVDGNATLFLHDTGIFVNCTGTSGLFFNGTANIGMDANAQVAGCTNDMTFPINPGSIQCNVPQQTYDQSYFDRYARTLPDPSSDCTQPGGSGSTMTPGYFNGTVTLSGATTFTDGTYCFRAGFNPGINPSTVLSGGSVKWVLSQKADMPATANFGSLEIYNGGFTIKGSGSLTANRFRFFGNGNTSFGVDANGTLTSGDAYIYSQLGNIDIRAQSNVNIQAPPPGDTFAGVLLYMPWENPNDFTLNGGTDDVWTGLVLMPQAQVTYNGGGAFELHGQVIAYEIKINGGSSGNIYYESTGGPGPAANPSIELTK